MQQKEDINIQPEKNEGIRIQKNEERLRNLQDILKRSNIQIIGVPAGEEEEQKIENLFEQIMKENFPNLAKEINFQEVQEAQSQESQRSWTQGGTHQGTSSLHYPRLTEGKNLRSSKSKGDSYLQWSSHKTVR